MTRPARLFYSFIPLILLLNILGIREVDIAYHDTYFVVVRWQLGLSFASILLVLGLFYHRGVISGASSIRNMVHLFLSICPILILSIPGFVVRRYHQLDAGGPGNPDEAAICLGLFLLGQFILLFPVKTGSD